jgi:hypothetical protein
MSVAIQALTRGEELFAMIQPAEAWAAWRTFLADAFGIGLLPRASGRPRIPTAGLCARRERPL